MKAFIAVVGITLGLVAAILIADELQRQLQRSNPSLPSVAPAPVDCYLNKKDGSVLSNVPAGDFLMGVRSKDSTVEDNEGPLRHLHLSTFQVSRFEVTNAQYGRFVRATSHRSAHNDKWKECAAQWGMQAPVVCVDWNDAQAYCQWAGLRLLSEEEWERTARGTDARIYPWGDEWDQSRAVFKTNRPSTVGSISSGISPAGCYDLAGNVCEWTSTNYDGKSSDYKVTRGGGWRDFNSAHLRTYKRYGSIAKECNDQLGFRCARTP